MRWEIKAGLYGLGVLVIIILTIISIGRLQPLPLPAPLPLGFLSYAIILFLDMLIQIWRYKSPHCMSNVGYDTITASKDIYHFPWHSDILKQDKDGKKEYGNLTFMFPGGIDYLGFNPDSGSESPVWIFPSRFEGKIGKCYPVYAWLRKTPFKFLPPEVRIILKREFPNRVKEKTEICYGTTGMLDGSDTPDNQKIEFEMQEKYEYAKQLEDRKDVLYQELRKAKEQKSKDIFIEKELKKAGEES